MYASKRLVSSSCCNLATDHEAIVKCRVTEDIAYCLVRVDAVRCVIRNFMIQPDIIRLDSSTMQPMQAWNIDCAVAGLNPGCQLMYPPIHICDAADATYKQDVVARRVYADDHIILLWIFSRIYKCDRCIQHGVDSLMIRCVDCCLDRFHGNGKTFHTMEGK